MNHYGWCSRSGLLVKGWVELGCADLVIEVEAEFSEPVEAVFVDIVKERLIQGQ